MGIKYLRQRAFSIFLALTCCTFANGAHSASASTESIVEGKIVEVVPAKKEIYVLSEGSKYEYYFKANTKIIKDGADSPFRELKEGMRVRVAALKIGKRLDPVTVEILE